MLRIVIRSFLCALICVPACAAAQTTPVEPETTLRTSTDLVIIDVTVIDSQRKPVRHLEAPDFSILEDGHPQTIKVLEEHAAGAPAPQPPAPKLDPGTFTNESLVPAGGALDILLFDKLNTPMEAQTQVRDQVLKYLKEAPAGTRMAIFTLTTKLKLLQGFTSDPEVLRALVEGKKGNASVPHFMADAVAGDRLTNPVTGQPGGNNPGTQAAEELVAGYGLQYVLDGLKEFEANQQSVQLQIRARYTLHALNLLARYLSNLPGRKNLIWFSGSFPISILPDPSLKDPFIVMGGVEDEFRQTVNLLARSQVAVYPIDARGLTEEPTMDASNIGTGMSRGTGNFAKDNQNFFAQTAVEQTTMNQMARDTGGEAFVNTNGLKGVIEKAIAAGSDYYTIAYTPTNRDWNGDYRKIDVKVDRPKIALSYRRGYYADDPSAPMKHKEEEGGKNAPPPYSAVDNAMLWGAPNPTEIIFTANVRLSVANPEDSVAPRNHVAPKITGPFHRYTVKFTIDPAQVKCDATSDGAHHCALEFRAYVYDTSGAQINVRSDGVKFNMPAASDTCLPAGKIIYPLEISAPVKGDFSLRIGVRDVANDHLGALEVPLAAVAELPPASNIGHQ
jgi:VWFA-related protein